MEHGGPHGAVQAVPTFVDFPERPLAYAPLQLKPVLRWLIGHGCCGTSRSTLEEERTGQSDTRAEPATKQRKRDEHLENLTPTTGGWYG